MRFGWWTYWAAVRRGVREEKARFDAGNGGGWAVCVDRTTSVVERALREKGWWTWVLLVWAWR